MRKRLSDPKWYQICIFIAVMGLFNVLIYCFKVVNVSWEYGLVKTQLPLVSVELNEPLKSSYEFPKYQYVESSSVAIVMGLDRFYFGDLEAFTVDYLKTDNKFEVPYVEKSPHTGLLSKSLKEWLFKYNRDHKISEKHLAVLICHDQLPLNVVVETLHYLKKTDIFKTVILGGEFI